MLKSRWGLSTKWSKPVITYFGHLGAVVASCKRNTDILFAFKAAVGRIERNTLEKLKRRTNILMQFLFQAAMLSSFFFTPFVTSHVHVSYSDIFFSVRDVVLQFSVTAKRFGHVSAFISATSTVSLWWILTSLVFIVTYRHIALIGSFWHARHLGNLDMGI